MVNDKLNTPYSVEAIIIASLMKDLNITEYTVPKDFKEPTSMFIDLDSSGSPVVKINRIEEEVNIAEPTLKTDKDVEEFLEKLNALCIETNIDLFADDFGSLVIDLEPWGGIVEIEVNKALHDASMPFIYLKRDDK